MRKLLPLILLGAIGISVKAQSQQANPSAQPYGKIDMADLEMTSCDFEKEAGAEVLFNVADGFCTQTVIVDYHKRIKIFNDKGASAANIRIEYYSIDNEAVVTGLEAETINLVDGKIEITKVDKKQIFKERVDQLRSAIVFAFPNVKPGSIIEYKYRLESHYFFQTWYFQSNIPERFNQITTSIPHNLYYKVQLHNNQPFLKNTLKEVAGNLNEQVYAMANVPSFNEEPLMSSRADNIQSAYYQQTGLYGATYYFRNLFDTWDKVGEFFMLNHFFGYEMNTGISGQKDILNNAKLLPTNNQKIAYIFNEVKNDIRWDNIDTWYTENGVTKAWENKSGNSTEINLILQSLLTSAGIVAFPVMVSTHRHGKINPAYPDIFHFNRAVVSVPDGNGGNYILDASSKFNVYNETPADLLNSYGLLMDNKDKIFKTIYIDNETPAKENVFINAEINADGIMQGQAQKSSYSYHKTAVAESYKVNGKENYKKALKGGNNNLDILDVTIENMDNDSLPVKQSISFKMDLAPAGDGYIYFSPNLFTSFKKDPFLSDQRFTDIDFRYLTSNSIVGIFKIPAGYKTETLPKSTRMIMPDKSISFTRIVAEQDGVISVRYLIDFQKSIFSKDGYPDFKTFYKKMYEMINEQIVLKKS